MQQETPHLQSRQNKITYAGQQACSKHCSKQQLLHPVKPVLQMFKHLESVQTSTVKGAPKCPKCVAVTTRKCLGGLNALPTCFSSRTPLNSRTPYHRHFSITSPISGHILNNRTFQRFTAQCSKHCSKQVTVAAYKVLEELCQSDSGYSSTRARELTTVRPQQQEP